MHFESKEDLTRLRNLTREILEHNKASIAGI